jgi:hypothetical protein
MVDRPSNDGRAPTRVTPGREATNRAQCETGRTEATVVTGAANKGKGITQRPQGNAEV